MTLKNNRAPLLFCLKLYASFDSHQWIQPKVIVRKRSIRVKIDDFFVLCDLEIWRMTLKNNSYATSSFVNHFVAVGEFKLELQSGNAQFRSKSIFLAVRPWNLTDDLVKQQGTSSKQYQALCTISSSYVNSNCMALVIITKISWSYDRNIVKKVW